MISSTVDWLDDRLGVREFLDKQAGRRVGKHVNFFYCLGGLTFFFFLLQVLTGMLLALYYVASPSEAHASVEYVQKEVSFGWLVRGLHYWGANGMVVMAGAHMLRVFFTGSYKPPRELNWVAGVLLLAVTLAFSFTGYLLPWDQKAYWATQLGTSLIGSVPLIGEFLLRLVRGGAEVSGVTLARFYAAHSLILPVVTLVLLGAHFLMVRRQGISGPL